MTQPPLDLPCALSREFTDDNARFEPAVFSGGAGDCLAITVSVGSTTSSAYLDREQIRTLFNYLGIWLHKH